MAIRSCSDLTYSMKGTSIIIVTVVSMMNKFMNGSVNQSINQSMQLIETTSNIDTFNNLKQVQYLSRSS